MLDCDEVVPGYILPWAVITWADMPHISGNISQHCVEGWKFNVDTHRSY